MDTNAKTELLEELKDCAKIKCAKITTGRDWMDDDERKIINLKTDYSDDDYHSFLNELNFEYDGGYGGQELFGNVWLEDGTWLERGEYDGSEWWEHKVCPDIPKELG